MGQPEGPATPENGAGDEEKGDGEKDEAQPQQAPLTDPLPGVSDIGRRGADHMGLSQRAELGRGLTESLGDGPE
jgi:hypothetical protein